MKSSIGNSRESSLREFASLFGTSLKSSKPPLSSKTSQNRDENKTMYGKRNVSYPYMSGIFETGNSALEFRKYLLDDPSSPIGGGICSFPSLELYSDSNNEALSKIPIPNNTSSSKALSGAKLILPRTSKHDNPNNSHECSKSKTLIACNLDVMLTWTHSTVHLTPMLMLRSISQTFHSILLSHVRSLGLILPRHTLSSSDEEKRSKLLAFLSSCDTVNITSVVTSFETLRAPTTFTETRSDELILPLIFETKLIICVREHTEMVKFRASGIILGNFVPNSSILKFVKVDMDTELLFHRMVEKARLVICNIMGKCVTSHLTFSKLKISSPQFKPTTQIKPTTHLKPSIQLKSSDAKSISNTSEYRWPELYRNRAIIQPKQNSTSESPSSDLTVKRRKNMSVTWNDPIKCVKNYVDTSNNKRTKLSQSNSLKSTISLGKPVNHVFQHRNESFSDFGRSPKIAKIASRRILSDASASLSFIASTPTAIKRDEISRLG